MFAHFSYCINFIITAPIEPRFTNEIKKTNLVLSDSIDAVIVIGASR